MTKINFCYHVMVQAIWFLIVRQIDNSLSRTCLNITQCTIGIDCASTSLFGQSVALSFFFFFLCNFTLFLQFLFGRCKLCFFLVCLFHFVFSWLTDFTKHFINIIFNAGTAKSATTNAYFADIGVPVANLWGQ